MALMCNIVYGQISQGGLPYSFDKTIKTKKNKSIQSRSNLRRTIMPRIDQSKIDSIKENNKKSERAFQFAYSFNVAIDIKAESTVDTLELGVLYRHIIKSPGAYSLNVIFTEYVVPRGAQLFLYNQEQNHLIGAFTSNNNKESQILPIIPVKGDMITVEYFEPFFSEFKGKLKIGKVNHDFTGFYGSREIEDDFGSSGNCQVDINCPEGDNWQNQKRSVIRIVKNGYTHCTAALVNNTNQDGRPYVLTAHHCLCNQNQIDQSIFIFNYESPTCDGSDGSVDQSISGGTLRATNGSSDFTLLELSKKPLSTFSAYYAGWDRNNIQGAGGVCIHHPSGDVKKISTYTMTPVDAQCLDVTASEACGSVTRSNSDFYRIRFVATDNGYGTTEPGSSGSPLFNNNHRIIGQLLGYDCTGPMCTDPANDISVYGKLSSSWDGTSANSRLRDWLNSENNVFVLDGIAGCKQGTPINLNITNTITLGSTEHHQATNEITASNIIEYGATAIYEAGNNVVLKPGFYAEAGSDFVARIGDCVKTCDPISTDILPNVFTPNGDGINDQLCYIVPNGTSFEFEAYDRWGQKVYSNSGSASGNLACVWDGSGSCSGCSYAIIITFETECEEVSEAYTVTVFGSGNLYSTGSKDSKKPNDNNLLSNTISEQDNQHLDFVISPNPSDGDFTIKVNTNETNPSFHLEIISPTGIVLYELKQINNNYIRINKSKFPNGIYYARLNNGKSIVTKKIIIQ